MHPGIIWFIKGTDSLAVRTAKTVVIIAGLRNYVPFLNTRVIGYGFTLPGLRLLGN
jgi:hypothetical protein